MAMAKARKRKTKVRKKTATRKKSASKKKSAAKKKVARRKSTRTAEAAAPAAQPKPKPQADDIDAKRTAVIECVNGAMDTNFKGWNDDGRGLGKNMETDLRADVNSMQGLLDVVRGCLKPDFVLDTNDDTYVRACVTSTVSQVINRTVKKTKKTKPA